jgi:hypothetical protein
LRGNARADFTNRFRFDENVGSEVFFCGDDSAVLNQQSHAPNSLSLLNGWSTLCIGRPLSPALRTLAGWNLDHRDAILDRADKRAEIASHTFGFIHTRNADERRSM